MLIRFSGEQQRYAPRSMRNPFRRYTSSRELSNFSWKTSFLPPGVTVDYQLKLPLGTAAIVDILSCFERELIFPLLRLPILLNCKGAGAGDTLLTIQGELKEDELMLPCSLTTTTQFHDFSEKDQIRFTWREELEPPALEGLSRYQLTHREDVTICSFLLTIEFFKHNLITRLGGLGPTVAERLSLDVRSGHLLLSIHSEGLSDTKDLPLNESEIMKKLDSAISSLFKFSVLEDYTAHD